MNSMDNPTAGVKETQDLKEEARNITTKFVDELISLKVLCLPSPYITVVNTFPLFLVSQSAHFGQHRTIGKGKQGGQNDVCVADSCHMTSPDHIVPCSYTSGFSTKLDLSNFFHLVLTQKDEHQYMELIHPKTGNHYVYWTLPMVIKYSQRASGGFAVAFIRMILNTSPLYQGKSVDNSI